MSSIMNRDTKFKPGFSGNETAIWRPGQSGNPAGKSKGCARFEEAFNEALITQGSAEEPRRLAVALASRVRQRALGHPGSVPPICPANPIPAFNPRGSR